jgi:hypothetical protein
MIIRYPDGSYVEGVIQRLERGTLRATLAGVDDAVEYTLVEDEWTSEVGEGVTFEFTMHREADLWLGTIGEGEPVCAAGGDCVLRRMPGSDAVRVN